MRGIQARLSGQDWPASQLHATRTLEDLPAASMPDIPLDEYGGDGRRTHETNGYFRAIRTGGRWWLITPAGHRFVQMAIAAVSPGRMKQGTLQLSGTAKAAFAQRFGGDARRWREQTLTLLRGARFNGTGGGSDDAILRQARQPMTYCPTHHFLAGYAKVRGGGGQAAATGCIPVFDADFEPFCKRQAEQLVGSADDVYLLGHFTDSALSIPADSLDRHLKLEPTDPGHREAVRWLTEQLGIPDPGRITAQLREIWRGHVADTYLRKVCGAIRKVDANHMILGPRLGGTEKDSEAVFAAAGRHLDVLAVDHPRCWTPGPEVLRWTQWSGRPVLLTGWSAAAEEDAASSGPGAAWVVHTPEERGWFYQNVALALLETGCCVGWHGFQYMDGDARGGAAGGGIVNSRFDPCAPLVEEMRDLNQRVYALVDHFDRG